MLSGAATVYAGSSVCATVLTLKCLCRCPHYCSARLRPDDASDAEQQCPAPLGTEHVHPLQEVLALLERHINDKDIQDELKTERDEVPYVRASTQRLEKDVYDTLVVGDYNERTRNRTATRERQRRKYEVLCPAPCLLSPLHLQTLHLLWLRELPCTGPSCGNTRLCTPRIKMIRGVYDSVGSRTKLHAYCCAEIHGKHL
jgi:hypothetical protein